MEDQFDTHTSAVAMFFDPNLEDMHARVAVPKPWNVNGKNARRNHFGRFLFQSRRVLSLNLTHSFAARRAQDTRVRGFVDRVCVRSSSYVTRVFRVDGVC